MLTLFTTLRLCKRPGQDGGQSASWEFTAMLKMCPQNSPMMYFDNHVDLLSRATSKL